MSSKKDILSLVDFLNSFLRPEKIIVQAQRKQDVLEVVIYFENAIDFSKVSRFVIREIRDGRLDSIEQSPFPPASKPKNNHSGTESHQAASIFCHIQRERLHTCKHQCH